MYSNSSLKLSILISFIALFSPYAVFAVTNPNCLMPYAGNCAEGQCCKGEGQCSSPVEYGVIGHACKEMKGGGTCSGQCTAPGICKADSCSGLNGGSKGIGDLSSLMQAIAGMLKALQGSPSPSSPSTPATTAGCTAYYNVTTPSSDPCAIYQPSVSSSITPTDIGSAATIPVDGTDVSVSSLINTQNDAAAATSTGGSPAFTGGVIGLSPGIMGNINLIQNGATFMVINYSVEKNALVTGFYGQTSGSDSMIIAAGICRARPWTSNFLSLLVPAAFFDGLCLARGFEVGAPVVAPAPVVKAPVVKSTGTIVPAAPVASAPAVVNIWAVPATVALGARTTVFWNAKNATSCTETSPDGSFSHDTLTGGAATVPLTADTTYTISCLTPDGGHVTNAFTVSLAI